MCTECTQYVHNMYTIYTQCPYHSEYLHILRIFFYNFTIFLYNENILSIDSKRLSVSVHIYFHLYLNIELSIRSKDTE